MNMNSPRFGKFTQATEKSALAQRDAADEVSTQWTIVKITNPSCRESIISEYDRIWKGNILLWQIMASMVWLSWKSAPAEIGSRFGGYLFLNHSTVQSCWKRCLRVVAVMQSLELWIDDVPAGGASYAVGRWCEWHEWRTFVTPCLFFGWKMNGWKFNCFP